MDDVSGGDEDDQVRGEDGGEEESGASDGGRVVDQCWRR